MIVAAVADTHTALWYLLKDQRLSSQAKASIEDAAVAREKIAVSSISLIEVVYLVEKGRIPATAYVDLLRAVADPQHVFVETPVSSVIAQSMRLVSRAEMPDMPDRIIAATGVFLNVPIISRDSHIRAAAVTTIW